MIIKAIRLLLGYIIVVISALTRPSKKKRLEAEQQKINQWAEQHALYQFYACPFCIKVRRAMRRLNVPIITKDAQQADHKAALLNGGGKVKVPCLRIETEGDTKWLYESKDIISYLEEHC